VKCRCIDKRVWEPWKTVTYGVDLQIPRLTWSVQVDCDFFIVETELLEGDVRAVGPRAEAVGVEDDLWGRHYGVWIMGVKVEKGNYIEKDTPL
jgi:hypothetical protein